VASHLVELSIRQAIDEKQIEPVAPPTVDKLELKPKRAAALFRAHRGARAGDT